MLELVTLRARPELRSQLFAEAMQGVWPEFMQHDPTAMLYFAEPHLDAYLDTAFAIIDASAPDIAVGRAFAVPFVFGDLPDRMELPDAGWDGVIRWAHRDRMLGRAANALSALEITLLPEQRGRGASRVILDAMRDHARTLGYRHMFAPVRPTAKHLEPFTPIGDYVRRHTAEGLPADPWLRVHVRAGGDDRQGGAGEHGDRRQHRRMEPLGSDVIHGFRSRSRCRVLWCRSMCRSSRTRLSYVEPNVWVRHSVT